MNGLALMAVLSLGTAPTLEVDLSFATGFGELVSLGGLAQGTARWQVWEAPAASGALGVGVLAGYQVEDYGVYGRLLPGTTLTGATHRFEALLVVGHEFRLLASRRLLVALQLFAGWMQVAQRGSLSNPEVGVSGTHVAEAGALSTGAVLRLGVRLTDRFSVVGRVLAPFPYATAVTPYVLLTLGASVEL